MPEIKITFAGEVKTFEQALEFWECNGYEIR